MKRTVDLRALKQFVYRTLPENWVLHDIILQEPDKLSASEFVVKIDIWLKLLRGKKP